MSALCQKRSSAQTDADAKFRLARPVPWLGCRSIDLWLSCAVKSVVMRRRVRPLHFSRLRESNLVRMVTYAPLARWSPYLQAASAILEGKKVAGPAARRIVGASLRHALVCARAIDRRALALTRLKNTAKVRKSFSRLAKCVARAPARLRNKLDNKIYRNMPDVIDTEVIESIIDATHQIFAGSTLESAKTARRALSVSKWKRRTIMGLKAEYSTLDLGTRRECERAISSETRTAAPGIARAVFKILTATIDENKPLSGLQLDAEDLIIDYVAAVAAVWQEHDLRPSRATRHKDPKYTSGFHRFAELILTAVAEPGSNRHSQDRDEVARQVWANHARLPAQMRQEIGKKLRREDMEWLVSDHHVREALRSVTLKTGHHTP
jgi:hypothetical protein